MHVFPAPHYQQQVCANLTAIPAANITGTFPAISGANLTNLTSTVSTTAPSSPSVGDMWFDSTAGMLAMKVWQALAWDQMSNKFSALVVLFHIHRWVTIKYTHLHHLAHLVYLLTAAVEYLVGGGGGGGGTIGGGGGAGGYSRTETGTHAKFTLSVLTVTVGAVAAGGHLHLHNGANSVFAHYSNWWR